MGRRWGASRIFTRHKGGGVQDNTITTDVFIVGGGPSGLAAAIHLADKFKGKGEKRRILLIEKGSSIGSHILSGAVIKLEVFKELLSEEEFNKLPLDSEVTFDETLKLSEKGAIPLPFHPPYMNNMGNHIVSLGKICKYLASIAEKKGVEIYTGFAASEVLYEDNMVVGVKAIDTGVDRQGNKLKNFQEGTSVMAKIVIFAEGARGSMAKTLINRFNLGSGKNPQIYSLGIKELWSVPESKNNIKAGRVYHTFGYPLSSKEEFGGGFVYGLKGNKAALGLVVGLDYIDPSFDIYAAMQVWKQHPKISRFIKGGRVIECGAKTLPEGGYLSIPKLYGDNFMIVGDSGGFLAMPALKGIHLAIASGMCAAASAALALVKNDTSDSQLAHYEELVQGGRIRAELYPVRNFRQSFTGGMIGGVLKFGVQLVTGGALPVIGNLTTEPDNKTLKKTSEYSPTPFKERFAGKLEFDGKLTFDKVTGVFHSRTNHDEEQPVHLIINDKEQFKRINMEQYGTPCQFFCPAEVYEVSVDREGRENLRINAENCLHCKTCDIKSPQDGITWIVPYGGDGPEYANM
jgi:electron-transferring-flavoprotein dehydrogenase